MQSQSTRAFSSVLLKILGATILLFQISYSWWQTGPQGTRVYDIVSLGNAIVVSTKDGIYRSTNKGISWTKASWVPSAYGIDVPTFYDDPVLLVSGKELYVVARPFIYISIDSGATWRQRGFTPSGYPLLSLASNNGNPIDVTFYAGTYDGLYRSVNYGVGWIKAKAPIEYQPYQNAIFSIAIVNNSTAFVGTDHTGIYRTTDRGLNWVEVSNGLPRAQASTISPLPYTRALHIIASDSALLAGCIGGVYRSTNLGESWTRVTTIPSSATFFTSVRMGENYIVVSWDGVYRYTEYSDGGSSWTLLSQNIRGNYDAPKLVAVGDDIYAGTTSGVYRSTDGGLHWEAPNDGIGQAGITALYADGTGAHDDAIYAGTELAGVFRSTDNGETWKAVSSGISNKIIMSMNSHIDARGGLNLFAQAGNGLYRSTDNGQIWSRVNTGFGILGAKDFVRHGANIYAAGWNGVYVSTDDGSNWFRTGDEGSGWTITSAGWPNSRVWSLAVIDTIIFAGTDGRGIFRSTNNGENWAAINTGFGDTSATTLAVSVDRQSNATLFAGTRSKGVYRSTDHGNNWTVVNSGLPNGTVWKLLATGTNIFAATSSGGVFFSPDNGGKWLPLGSGQAGNDIRGLTLRGTDIYFGAITGGVSRRTFLDLFGTAGIPSAMMLKSGNSQNGLITTATTEPFVVTVTDPAGNPVQGAKVTFSIAKTPIGAAGQLLSTHTTTTDAEGRASTALTFGNRGGEFVIAASSNGLYGSPVLFAAKAISPEPTLKELSRADAGLGSSINVTLAGTNFFDGATTADFGEGITINSISVRSRRIMVVNISVSSKASLGERNVSVTNPPQGGGTATLINAFIVDTSPPTGVERDGEGVPSEYALRSAYPNPFNPSTTFEFDIPRQEIVVLTIFDMLGRRVQTLVEEEVNPGTYKVRWDAAGFPSGVYMYRLQAGAFTETKRLVLMK